MGNWVIMEIKTLYHLFDSLEQLYKDKPVLKFRNIYGEWENISAKDIRKNVYNIAMGLMSLGLEKGDKVCLMSHTRYEWTLIDFAIEITGLINIPIYPTLTKQQIKFIVNDSNAKAFIASDYNSISKVLKNKEEMSNIKNYIIIDEKEIDALNTNKTQTKLLTIKQIIKKGKSALKKKDSTHPENIGKNINENDLASILYTSGTTGKPKGVMLTHKNFISNGLGALHKLKLDKYNNTMVFLPLSHAFSRTCTYGLLSGGVTLWYAENLDTLARDMVEAKPEVMIVVPRVFEKIYERILDSANKSGKIKKLLFYWAKRIGERVAIKKERKKKLSPLLKFRYNLADKLVFEKIRSKTGGKLIFAVSGSSPMSKQISYFFQSVKINILEGYGLTEASPVVSTNTLEQNKIGTVGTPFENVQVKTANDGEILVKGPNVMLGYHNDEELTKKTITQDGWLKTGDIGKIDSEGYIRIVDRKKDMLKTSGGKYIVPKKIENLAKVNEYIQEFVVVADNRKFASAIILPNFEKIRAYADNNNIKYKENSDLIADDKIISLFQRIIDEEINSTLARYETIKKFILIDKQFTIENNELTPSLKIKRKHIYKHYNKRISKLYND